MTSLKFVALSLQSNGSLITYLIVHKKFLIPVIIHAGVQLPRRTPRKLLVSPPVMLRPRPRPRPRGQNRRPRPRPRPRGSKPRPRPRVKGLGLVALASMVEAFLTRPTSSTELLLNNVGAYFSVAIV